MANSPSTEVDTRFGLVLPPPYSLLNNPTELNIGLWFLGLLATLSVVSTVTLLGFITYRMVSWRRYYENNVGHNQCIIFILNLLLADLFQASSFLISFHWLSLDAIVAPTTACTAQGWLLNFGDLSSGFFVLAIAIHTWLSVVRGIRTKLVTFVISITCVWTGATVLTSFGLARHPRDFFVHTGAWCWISPAFDSERLWLHYFWIFLFEASTVIIYASIFLNLRARVKTIRMANSQNFDRIKRAATYMAVYPVVYVLLTLPLAVGRMASLAGANPPDGFFIFAGCLMTSAGWVDSLLYTLTRRVLLHDGSAPHSDHSTHDTERRTGRPHSFGLNRMLGGSDGFDNNHQRTVTITAGKNPPSQKTDFNRRKEYRRNSSAGSVTLGQIGRSESTSRLNAPMSPMNFGDVKAETKVEVTVAQVENRRSSSESARQPPLGSRPHSGASGNRTAFPFD